MKKKKKRRKLVIQNSKTKENEKEVQIIKKFDGWEKLIKRRLTLFRFLKKIT